MNKKLSAQERELQKERKRGDDLERKIQSAELQLDVIERVEEENKEQARLSADKTLEEIWLPNWCFQTEFELEFHLSCPILSCPIFGQVPNLYVHFICGQPRLGHAEYNCKLRTQM